MMTFQSNIIICPGLGNSGPQHWQSVWEREQHFYRVEQKDWVTPVCNDWVEVINKVVQQFNPAEVIIAAHSLACITVAFWARKYDVKIKGALMVAPSDTEAATFPAGTSGFTPIPLVKLPFPSTVTASTNDYYLAIDRAKLFADSWGSEFINIGQAGHINVASGFGSWNEGLSYLKRLDT